MKKVYETISGMMFPGIVFAAIMALVAGAALLGKVGKRLDTEGEDFSCMADTQAVETVCAREEPKIQYDGKNVWGVGEVLWIADTFSAVDAEGNPLSVRVLEITDQNGSSVSSCYQEEEHRAVFERRGIYTFSLEAVDQERKAGVRKISILVDER